MKTAYRAARIIDGVRGAAIEGHALVVADGRIEAIVPVAALAGDVRIVNLPGCTLLPGLIDAHVHMVDDASARPRGLVETETSGMTLLRTAQRAAACLRAGITGLRDMGASAGIMPTLRDAGLASVLDIPRIITCDTQLTITGGYGRRFNVLGQEVDGVEGMRKQVRLHAKAGADFIKLMVSGQVSNAGAGVDAVQFTQAELDVAVEEAHRLGLRVAVHAIGLHGIRASVRAGVDCIEHGNFLTIDLAAEMAARGIFLVPTLLTYRLLAHPPAELRLPHDVQAKAAIAWAASRQAMVLALEAGVRIGAGTDGGGPCIAHDAIVGEIILLAECGLSPAAAIAAATSVNAQILGLADGGSLAPGQRADVIAVRGNPLEDLCALRNIELVLLRGRALTPTPAAL